MTLLPRVARTSYLPPRRRTVAWYGRQPPSATRPLRVMRRLANLRAKLRASLHDPLPAVTFSAPPRVLPHSTYAEAADGMTRTRPSIATNAATRPWNGTVVLSWRPGIPERSAAARSHRESRCQFTDGDGHPYQQRPAIAAHAFLTASWWPPRDACRDRFVCSAAVERSSRRRSLTRTARGAGARAHRLPRCRCERAS